MRHSCARLEGPAILHLAGPDAEVTVALVRAPDDPAILSAASSPHDRERANRMGSPARRVSFLCGRLLARKMLERDGQRLVGEPGSPPSVGGDGPIRSVSLSHSWGWVAVAVSTSRAVGVDLELSPRRRDLRLLNRRLAWAANSHHEFLRRWSLWEATGKSAGLGVFRNADPCFEALLAVLEGQPIGQPGLRAEGTGIWCPVSTGWLCVAVPERRLPDVILGPLPEALRLP